MKNLLALIALLFVCHISHGQEMTSSDTASTSPDIQMEKIVTDPVFYLTTQNDSCILLTKPQLRTINEKWVDKIEVFTEDEKLKESEYKGRETLIFITLKNKQEKKFLESIESGS